MKNPERLGPGLIAGALSMVLCIQVAGAATCMDELDRFERRLHSSGLAARDPDTFQALARQAEEAAELRDEEECLQSVAELNSELPEDASSQPVSRQTSPTGGGITRDNSSRPAAPVLIIAGGEGTEATSTEDEADETDEGSESADDPIDD